MEIDKLITKQAIGVTSNTLLGVSSKEYPLEWGNCFSVKTSDDGNYKIVNFIVENLEEVIRRGVNWPITIKVLSDNIAVINDIRIPHNWYRDRWCTTCCPKDLLPIPQQLEYERNILSGVYVKNGPLLYIDHSKAPTI